MQARHLILLGMVIAASVPACTVETGSRRDRPNIILILADDLGYETLGAYGGRSYTTPMLDRLARQGIRFDHAYSQPLCTNTRVQLMTGRYQHRYWQGFGILVESDVLEANPIQVSQRTEEERRITGKFQAVLERIEGSEE